MKKGYILTMVFLLVMAVAWGYNNYEQKTAPVPTDEETKASNSAAPANAKQADAPPAKGNPDKEQTANPAPASENEASSSLNTKAEQPARPVSNKTANKQTPLSAAETIEQAKANGESMWLLFRSRTCSPCVEMKKVFDQLQPEYQGKVRFISIDVDEGENQELVETWKIQYIPATFILNGEGEISYQNVGFFPVEDLKKELDRVVK